jgi:hypothetical protein
MLAIVNFIAVFVVSAVVAYQIYDTINQYNNINNKLIALEQEDDSTKSSINKTRKDLSDKVSATEQQFNKQIENTTTSLTKELNALDKFFKSLSEQVVTTTTTTDKLKLGQKFQLSGVGDPIGNDDWLRLLDGNGEKYYGGLATNKLMVEDKTQFNNDLNISNGKINFLKSDVGPMIEKAHEKVNDRYGVGQFSNGAMRMYTSGLTKPATAGLSVLKPDGNLDDVLTVTTDKLTNVYGDMDVRGKLFLGRVDDSTYPYTFEKNQSALRLTINDNSDEALEIWGDSCATGNCAGEGTLKHKFQANGDVHHEGNLQVKNRLLVNRTPSDKYPDLGNGIHALDIYANGTIGVGNDGDIAAAMNGSGKIQAKTLCIDDVCLNATQLNAIKTQANI